MKYIKTMSPTDCGWTKTHQAGMLVPKDRALLDFLPSLDVTVENPDAQFVCVDPLGEIWHFRYVYYNKRLFGSGTRNEYRITGLTKFIKKFEIQPGDELVISKQSDSLYSIKINRTETLPNAGVIKLRGWRQVF